MELQDYIWDKKCYGEIAFGGIFGVIKSIVENWRGLLGSNCTHYNYLNISQLTSNTSNFL